MKREGTSRNISASRKGIKKESATPESGHPSGKAKFKSKPTASTV